MCLASHLASHRAGNQLDGTSQSEILRSMLGTDYSCTVCKKGFWQAYHLHTDLQIHLLPSFRRRRWLCCGGDLEGRGGGKGVWQGKATQIQKRDEARAIFEAALA